MFLEIAGVIFLGSILLGLMLMLAMAQNWPHLIRLWQRTEAVFLKKPYAINGMTLKWRLRLVAFGVMFVALGTNGVVLLMYKSKYLI